MASMYGKILATIRQAPHSLTVSQIAEQALIEPGKVQEMVIYLREKHFLAKNRASEEGDPSYYIRTEARPIVTFLCIQSWTDEQIANHGGMDKRSTWFDREDIQEEMPYEDSNEFEDEQEEHECTLSIEQTTRPVMGTMPRPRRIPVAQPHIDPNDDGSQ